MSTADDYFDNIDVDLNHFNEFNSIFFIAVMVGILVLYILILDLLEQMVMHSSYIYHY